MDIKTLLKSSVAAGALLALAAPMHTAEAGGISGGNSKMDLKVGGRVLRGIAYADDGENTGVFHVGGRSADTELYFSASGKLTESVSVGAVYRMDVNESASTYSFGGANKKTNVAGNFGEKYSKIHFAHKSLGTLHMGNMEEAGDGATNLKFGMAISGTPGTFVGDIQPQLKSGGVSTATAKSRMSSLGGGRHNLVRYDSPTFAGFKVSLSEAGVNGTSTALRYSGAFAGVKVKAAGHWTKNEDHGDNISYGGSFAAQHSSGLHIAAAYGTNKDDHDTKPDGVYDINAQYRRLSGGYEAKVNSLGKTDFYVQWMNNSGVSVPGSRATELNFGATQSLDSIGGRIGLVYSNVSGKQGDGQRAVKDIDVVYMETQINF